MGKLSIVSLFCSVLIIAFFLLLAWQFTLPIPYQDDFNFLMYLIRLTDAQGSIASIYKATFLTENDHILVIPRLIILADYYLTGALHYKLYIFLNISLLIYCLIIIAGWARQIHQLMGFFLVVALCLHMQTYDVTLWAMSGLSHIGALFFTMWALNFAAKSGHAGHAAIFCALATFTCGSGIVSFLAVGYVYIVQRNYHKMYRFAAAFIGVLVFYLVNYEASPVKRPAFAFISFVKGYFSLVASPLIPFIKSSPTLMLAGGTITILAVILLVITHKRSGDTFTSTPHTKLGGLLIYSCGTLAIIAMGRAVDALPDISRYQFYAVILLAVMVLLHIEIRQIKLAGLGYGGIIIVVGLLWNFKQNFVYTACVKYRHQALLSDTYNARYANTLYSVSHGLYTNLQAVFERLNALQIAYYPASFVLPHNIQKAYEQARIKNITLKTNAGASGGFLPEVLHCKQHDDLTITLNCAQITPPASGILRFLLLREESTGVFHVLPMRTHIASIRNFLKGNSYLSSNSDVYLKPPIGLNGSYKLAIMDWSVNSMQVFKTEHTLNFNSDFFYTNTKY